MNTATFHRNKASEYLRTRTSLEREMLRLKKEIQKIQCEIDHHIELFWELKEVA